MEFLFFASDNTRLFVRDDAERAEWTVEEMSLSCLFPYKPDKAIQRGMRIGFYDQDSVFQPFEIRKVKTYEPDHYQEITAEHVAIAELSDEHINQTTIEDETGGVAIGDVLGATPWMVGDDTTNQEQTYDISRGSVWQAVKTIEQTANVYATPRVVVGAGGLSTRYLDVHPAAPVWRGVRLSLDKNADEVGVTWDDTNVITAIYGYGGTVQGATEDDTKILTFTNVAWSETTSHPAKPLGQPYLVDPDATALYGRNGRPRFGYYQNADIKDANLLLQKSWEALKISNAPDVSIDCRVADLYRLGYADQPLHLHDQAIIEVRPTGEMLEREIIRLTVDLLDPTNTYVTIGAYVPNIVYMQRQTDVSARGGGGGGRRGTSKSNTSAEDNLKYEFETEIGANRYQINLRAYQRDMNVVDSILRQAGMQLDAYGVLIYATDNANNVMSYINTQADRISLVVQGSGANASIKAAQIVASINDSGSSVLISADKIVLDGSTTVDRLLTGNARISSMLVHTLTVRGPYGSLTLDDSNFYVGNNQASWKSATIVKSVTLNNYHGFLYADNTSDFNVTGRSWGYVVNTVTPDTIYYLGHS